MREVVSKVYKFDELSDDAKEKAREWYRNGSLDYDWYNSVYEDAKTCGALIGIEIDKIYFSGFSSQGDGACFEGEYQYKKGALKAIKEHAPKDTELHNIAMELQKEQRKHFYSLGARAEHSGYYYHSGCMHVDVFNRDGDIDNDVITDQLRYFADWIYSQLEKEYDFLNSDAQVDESIIANEYEFTEEGERV